MPWVAPTARAVAWVEVRSSEAWALFGASAQAPSFGEQVAVGSPPVAVPELPETEGHPCQPVFPVFAHSNSCASVHSDRTSLSPLRAKEQSGIPQGQLGKTG